MNKAATIILKTVCTIIFNLVMIVLVFVAAVGKPLTDWYMTTFHTSFREIVYTYDLGLKGADMSFFKEAVTECKREIIIFVCIIALLIITQIILLKFRRAGRIKRGAIPILMIFILVTAALMSVPNVKYANNVLKVGQFIKLRFINTKLYDDYYVNPNDVLVESKNSRNLILIYGESLETTYNSDTANVIACTDKQISDFVSWCKEQDFYENTTIVILGDHPRLDKKLVKGVDMYEREAYNCFINAAAEVKNSKQRLATTMDLFPTILASMGFYIEGDRLGLGTNLFSDEKTLAEELTYDKLNDEVGKNSKYYQENFS